MVRDTRQATSFFLSLSLHAALFALAIVGVGDRLKVDMDKPMYTVNLVSLNQSEDPAAGEMGEAAGAPPPQEAQEDSAAAAQAEQAASKPIDLKAEKPKPQPVKDDAKAISEKKVDEKKKPEPEKKKEPEKKPEPEKEAKKSKEDLLKEALQDVKKDVAASDKGKPKPDAKKDGKKDAVASELAELRKGAGGNIFTAGGTGPGGAGGGKGTGAGGTGSGLMSVYGAIVEQAIKKNWRYPTFAQDKNVAVVLEIKIDPRGGISSSRVLTPSGKPDFDDSAMRAVAQTEKLPPPPTKNVDTLRITFNLQDLRK